MESIERIPAAVVRTAVRIDGTLLKSNDTYRYQVLYVLVQTAVCGYMHLHSTAFTIFSSPCIVALFVWLLSL